jgi:hypothetical protein
VRRWHFIDEPFSTDDTPLQQPVPPNAETQIAVFRKTLADKTISDDIRSYDLAWLLHLVGGCISCCTRPPKLASLRCIQCSSSEAPYR